MSKVLQEYQQINHGSNWQKNDVASYGSPFASPIASAARSTKVYLGDNFKALATAIKDFLLQVPFIGPNDLEGIPFLPSGISGPLPKTTPQSFTLAYEKMVNALEVFLAQPQLLDPDNYLDSVMSQYVNISRQHFAILHQDIKAYYLSQPNGFLKAQMYERVIGGMLVTPSSPAGQIDPDFVGK